MLNNDQCEQVVEEIWGWGYKEHEHREIVNSWEGFGLTVEAIDATDSEFYGNSLNSYIRGEITKTELWEATHLAALEAMKK